MRTATAKAETVRCPVHVGVMMTPVEMPYPRIAGWMDNATRTRTIFKCPVTGCARVMSNAPSLEEMEEAEELTD